MFYGPVYTSSFQNYILSQRSSLMKVHYKARVKLFNVMHTIWVYLYSVKIKTYNIGTKLIHRSVLFC